MKKGEESITSAGMHRQQAEGSSLQVQLKLKHRVFLSASEMKAIELILGDYSIRKPRWLRLECKVTLSRTKFLKELLADAGVGTEWCQFVSPHDCWDTNAHTAWHILVGRSCDATSK